MSEMTLKEKLKTRLRRSLVLMSEAKRNIAVEKILNTPKKSQFNISGFFKAKEEGDFEQTVNECFKTFTAAERLDWNAWTAAMIDVRAALEHLETDEYDDNLQKVIGAGVI